MSLKNNRAFTLLEVLITVAILSSAIIFVFRAFTASLAANRLSQNITRACFVAEAKLWEALHLSLRNKAIPASGSENIDNLDINWSFRSGHSSPDGLRPLTVSVYWRENTREKNVSMEFTTLIPIKNERSTP
jgi:type II secretion system protein I